MNERAFSYPLKLNSKSKQLCLRLWYLRFGLPEILKPLASTVHIYATRSTEEQNWAISGYCLSAVSYNVWYHGWWMSRHYIQVIYFRSMEMPVLKHYFFSSPSRTFASAGKWLIKIYKCLMSVCQNKLLFLSTLTSKYIKHLHKVAHLSYS